MIFSFCSLCFWSPPAPVGNISSAAKCSIMFTSAEQLYCGFLEVFLWKRRLRKLWMWTRLVNNELMILRRFFSHCRCVGSFTAQNLFLIPLIRPGGSVHVRALCCVWLEAQFKVISCYQISRVKFRNTNTSFTQISFLPWFIFMIRQTRHEASALTQRHASLERTELQRWFSPPVRSPSH